MWGLLAAPIIQGITGLIAGNKKAKAQKEAAKIQSDAAEKVKGINTGVYQSQMAGMEPYAALGRNTANTLGRLMTPGVPYRPMDQLQDARSQQSALPPWAMNPGAAQNAAATPPPKMLFGRQVSAQQPPPGQQPPGQLGALASQMVPLRGPDGSVRAVPANMVEDFMRRGAVKV